MSAVAAYATVFPAYFAGSSRRPDCHQRRSPSQSRLWRSCSEAIPAARSADWLAGVLDLQLLSPVPDLEARVELFAEALGIAISWHDRIDPTEAMLLAKVFADSELVYEIPATDPIAQPTRAMREFGSVGIYSLSESAAQTAGRWIKDEWPGARVRLSHVHENGPELEGLIRTSDVLLMQTSHAKHAATTAIERSADPSRLVRVNGRGATALFRGLVEWTTAD